MPTLRIEPREAVGLSDGWADKPFEPTEGFSPTWWVGGAKASNVVWCSVIHETLGEVARVQLKLGSDVGEGYPTRPIPTGGATEIDLLEVRQDVQGTKHRVGRQTVALIQKRYPGPYVAISLNDKSDRFWRRLGWDEHAHEDADPAGVGRQPRLLFGSD